MPTKLRKLKITHVAVCEQGANYDTATGAGAHILLFKSAPAAAVEKQGHVEPDGDETWPLDYATRSQQQTLWRSLWDKWERFVGTFYDVTGDCDEDNVPHLPILVASIGQFQADVASLLDSLGLTAKMAPALTDLATVVKAGAPMAEHRLTRLREAITALQRILEECTPPTIDHAGVSAAEVAGIALMDTSKGVEPSNPLEKEYPVSGTVESGNALQSQLDALTKRAEAAEAQVATLTASLATADTTLAKAQQDLAALQEEQRIAKMRPEEQREALLASMPELVRKSYLDQETRLAVIEKANQDLHAKNERLDYIQKAVQYRSLGIVPDDHWEIFKAIDAMPEKVRTDLERMLKAAAEQAKVSPWMTTVGSQGGSSAQHGSSAEAQLHSLIAAHQAEKGGTPADAISVVAKAHPDLWNQYQQEKRFRNRVESAPSASE